MKFDILTLFPEMIEGFLSESILGRAVKNNIIDINEKYDFLDKYIDVAKLYYKKTNKCLYFVPQYQADKLKTIVFGKPIQYNPSIEINEQRKIINDCYDKTKKIITENRIII